MDRKNKNNLWLTLKNSPAGLWGIIFIFLLLFHGKISPSVAPALEKIASPPSPYAAVSLSARAAFVYDAKNGKELFGRNADATLPLASLAKVMTAVTAFSLLPENTVIVIDPESLSTEGDSGLFASEKWTLKDLLALTLLESSNDGASAIAASAAAAGEEELLHSVRMERFTAYMNEKAKEFGLTQTYFLNPTGLDENEFVSGAYGSARDTAVLFWRAVSAYPALFGATRYKEKEFVSLSSLRHRVKNTNEFVGSVPSLLASKTGYTDLAGGNLVIAFDAGVARPIVISILGSTAEGRFTDAEKLVFATLEYFKTQENE